jgi:NitT/TauT family transport system ATP-binding protein
MSLVPLTVGFVPLIDCAPLVVAVEMGFAAAEGLTLTLKRENAWATIRDRVIVGHFQAAQMLGPMPIASRLGVGQLTVDLIAPMALGWGGNAITVAGATWQAMCAQGAAEAAGPAQQGRALRAVLGARALSGAAPLTLAMVHPFSSHHYALRYWLAASGIDPDEDVRLVVVPPAFMVDALRDGQIDGFCVGEPWNSLAVAAGAGNIVTPTTAIWQRNPEKVLGMRADWALRHPDETKALIRALYRACHWCDHAEAGELARLLARPDIIGEPAAEIERGLSGALCLAPGSVPVTVAEFQGFARQFGTVPRASHALWFHTQMVRWKQLPAASAAESAARAATARDTYRCDLYRDAVQSLGVEVPVVDQAGGFFDES